MKRFIVIHHSLTKDGETVSWDAIRNYHIKERGFTDIGYHFGIEKIGYRYETLIGRMPNETGAHCKELGMNSLAYGICLVGDFDSAAPPKEQLFAAALLCAFLCKDKNIPVRHIYGHREVGRLAGFNWEEGEYKSCPGSQLSMDELRTDVQRMLDA